jgi:serine/threonine-protein kinase PknG
MTCTQPGCGGNPRIPQNKRHRSGCDQPAGNGPIMGCEPNARALRFGLERSYRALARLTPDEDRRIELVDMANAIRPRTLT